MTETKGFFVILLVGMILISFMFYMAGHVNGYSDCGDYVIDNILIGGGKK